MTRPAVVVRSSWLAVVLVLLLAAAPADAASAAASVLKTGLPSHTLTPGIANPAVTQATIHRTICVSGWTATIRPSSSYTNHLKTVQLAQYGFVDRNPSDYEEDHLISLELGGSPASPKNLWPEPHHIRVAGLDLGSYAKDGFENHLRALVCAGRLSLHNAQQEIDLNWVAYWSAWKNATGSSPVNAPTTTPTPTTAPATVLPASVEAARKAGASAVCNDGTWSFSASRSGTCSRHGGVYWWTGNLGPAGPG